MWIQTGRILHSLLGDKIQRSYVRKCLNTLVLFLLIFDENTHQSWLWCIFCKKEVCGSVQVLYRFGCRKCTQNNHSGAQRGPKRAKESSKAPLRNTVKKILKKGVKMRCASPTFGYRFWVKIQNYPGEGPTTERVAQLLKWRFGCKVACCKVGRV